MLENRRTPTAALHQPQSSLCSQVLCTIPILVPRRVLSNLCHVWYLCCLDVFSGEVCSRSTCPAAACTSSRRQSQSRCPSYGPSLCWARQYLVHGRWCTFRDSEFDPLIQSCRATLSTSPLRGAQRSIATETDQGDVEQISPGRELRDDETVDASGLVVVGWSGRNSPHFIACTMC